MNLSDLLRRHAESTPDALAYVGDGIAFTYRDLDTLIDTVAQRALDASVRPGHRVSLAIRRDLPILTAILALARIGAVSINRLDREDPCDVCMATPENGPSTVARTIDVTEDWFTRAAASREGPVTPFAGGDAVCRIFRTSGTTGKPKFVAMTHASLLQRLALRARASPLPSPVRSLSMVRPGSSYGFQVTMRVLSEGGTVVDAPYLNGLPAAIVRQRVNYLTISPGILAPLIAQMQPGEGPFPSLALVEVSGARLTAPLARAASTRVSPHLVLLYGSTESGIVAIAPYPEIAGRDGAVGHVVPGVEVEAVDAAGMPVARGTDGILRFRGETVATEYADGSGHAKAFRGGWFYSGDMGRIDADGVLVIAGRTDERINIGGEKLAPEVIEQFAVSLPGIVDAAAFAFPSSLGIDRVGIAIVAGPGFEFEPFKERCNAELGIFSPAIVLNMAAIPRNENGKVPRHALVKLVPAAAQATD
ncbi:MAG: class I adenylate-forming enzyme family protein [Betaproteobacteria bacterium]